MQYQLEDFDENLWEDIERIYCARQEDRVGVSTLAWAKEVVRRLAQQKILYISTLKKDNKRIAFLIFFNDSNSYYIWLTAFQKTNDLRLGHYIRYCLIEKAYNENISVVDMMRGAYDYKKEWDCNVTFNYEFIIFRSRWKKRMYLWKQKLRKRIRNIVYNNKFLKKIYQKKSKH